MGSIALLGTGVATRTIEKVLTNDKMTNVNRASSVLIVGAGVALAYVASVPKIHVNS